MSLEAKLEGMPKNAVATDSAGGSESAQPAPSNALCKVCKAVVNIEKEESGNPFEDDVYSGAEESSEESQEEESKDKVGSLVPTSSNSEPKKPVVNKDAQRATRFLSVSSQNFLRSNSMRKDASPQMTQMLKEKLVELGKMTERVVKVEKLLCETLENMDYQQK